MPADGGFSASRLPDSEIRPQREVVVVGAGLAGLMAARHLRDKEFGVRILEAAPQVGGRLATKRLGNGVADTGAQFFTVRTPEFAACVDRWIKEGLVFTWSRGWTDASLEPVTRREGHVRFAVRDGMLALAQALAHDLRIETSAPVSAIRQEGTGWVVDRQPGGSVRGHAVLLTPPVPQALQILDAGNIELEAEDRRELQRIRYGPCLCGMFLFDGPIRLPEPGAVQQVDDTVSWVADNHRKGISPAATVVTAHLSAEASVSRWTNSEEEILGLLRRRVLPFVPEGVEEIDARLERWTHAVPLTVHPERRLVATGLPPLVFAGDAFGEPRVEGAALSGLAAAVALESSLKGRRL